MKKIYFLLALFLSFFGAAAVQAQDDEIVVEISKNTGGWTASGSPAYANEYETKDKEHGIRIKCVHNNMTFWDGTWLSIYSAYSSSQTYDYTITSLSKTHYIGKVEFDFTPGKHPSHPIGPISVQIDESTARAEVGNTEHFEFVNEDDNSKTQLVLTVSSDETSYHAFANTSNFYITLKPRPAIDVAWDKLIEIMDAHDFEEEQFPSDGTPGSYDAAAAEAFFTALAAAHALEDEDPESITEEMLAQHGQAIIDAYEALLASRVPYDNVADGYYRFRTGLTYSTGDKYMYAIEQVNSNGSVYYYSMWATPDEGDATDAASILWKVSKNGKGYDVVPAIYPEQHFNALSVNRLTSGSSQIPRMTEDGAGELIFDPAATIDGITYFSIYASGDDPSSNVRFHQNGHSSGAGSYGYVIGWYSTYTAVSGPGASEWYLEPVSDAEVEEILAAYEPIRQQKELTAAYNELKATADKELTDSKELQYSALITEVDQLSSPYTSTAEGSIADLIDNNSSTYWHSDYSVNPGYHVHYLQVALHEGGYGELQLSMTRRNGAGNDHITQWGVFGSNDPAAADEDWVELASLDMPFANNTETKTATFDSKGYQYLRFYIDRTTGGETRGFGHCSEFQLFQIEMPETSQYAIIGEPAKALDNLLKEQATINPNEVTQEEFDALKAAYDAFKAQFVDPTELREVIAKAEAFADGIVIGSNPGTWNSGSVADQLQLTLADAKAYDDAKIYKQATSQDFITKINNLLDGVLEAANSIKTDTWYRFRFGSEETFIANGWDTEAGAAVVGSDESVQDEALWDKYVVAARVESNDGVRSVLPIYTEEALLGTGLFVDASDDIQDAELAQFRFIAVGDTAYMIQNRATGLFVKAAGTTGGVTLDLHPTLFTVSPLGFGFNLIAAKDLEGAKQNYLHVARNYNQLVTWDASNVGSRSSLLIEEIGSAAGYTEPGFYMEIQAGALYAMCYPVDITVEEGNGALYSVEKVEGTHVTFAAINKVEAGHPFVYKLGEVEEYNDDNTPDLVKFHHGYDLEPKAQEGANFVGTYVQKTLGEGYIVTGGALRAILGIYHNNEPLNQLFMTEAFITNGVNAHGAYIIPEEGAIGAVTFDFDGTEDGIAIATDNVRRDGKVYSIDGRIIGTAENFSGISKGLYIINGAKVVVK